MDVVLCSATELSKSAKNFIKRIKRHIERPVTKSIGLQLSVTSAVRRFQSHPNSCFSNATLWGRRSIINRKRLATLIVIEGFDSAECYFVALDSRCKPDGLVVCNKVITPHFSFFNYLHLCSLAKTVQMLGANAFSHPRLEQTFFSNHVFKCSLAFPCYEIVICGVGYLNV